MDVSTTRRIVMLGKTGVGRSSLANTIFGEELFKIAHTPNYETSKCQADTRSVNGRRVTLIDTPGFFDTEKPDEELKPEIMKCITECAPGLHAFLIVLSAGKFTDQEQVIINEIQHNFSEEVYKYTTVLFTHGDQIPEGMEIGEWVDHNADLRDLVMKCGGRCHVVDNKYWKNNQQDEYRNNQVRVEALLNTIDEMIEANGGSYYTNEMLQAVEEEIRQEEERIRLSAGDMSEEELREQAKRRVLKKLLIRLAGCTTGVLLGALFGVVMMVGAVSTVLKNPSKLVKLQQAAAETAQVALQLIAETAAGGGAGAAAARAAAGVAGPLCALGVGCLAVVAGAVKGGVAGYRAAEGANTPREAVERAAEAVKSDAQADLNQVHAEVMRLF